MKKPLAILLAAALLLSALTGCAQKAAVPEATAAPTPTGTPAPTPEPEPEDPVRVVDDGRARPSSCGRLQVVNGKLCDENGQPVMLRGVSCNGPKYSGFVREDYTATGIWLLDTLAKYTGR